MTVSQTILVLETILEVLVRGFVGCLCLVFSHDETEVMGLGEEDHRGKVPLSAHRIECAYYQHDLYC